MARNEGRDPAEDDADDQDDPDDEDDSNESEGGTGADEDDDYTPPSREEVELMRRTLEKRNKEKRVLRQKLREKAAGNGSPAGTGATGPSADDIRQELQTASDKRFVVSEARSALKGAGLVDDSPEAVRRAVRLLDLDDVEVDGDDVDGLDDAISALKTSMPSLFKKAPRKAPGGKVTTGSRQGSGGTGPAKLTSAQKLAKQLQG